MDILEKAFNEKGKKDAVRHGKWIEKEKDGFLHCSNCGYVRIGIPIMFNFEYCPKCGTKMDGE